MKFKMFLAIALMAMFVSSASAQAIPPKGENYAGVVAFATKYQEVDLVPSSAVVDGPVRYAVGHEGPTNGGLIMLYDMQLFAWYQVEWQATKLDGSVDPPVTKWKMMILGVPLQLGGWWIFENSTGFDPAWEQTLDLTGYKKLTVKVKYPFSLFGVNTTNVDWEFNR